MKSILAMIVAMAVPAAAWAGGVNLAWTDCLGGGLGTTNRNFACNSNAGVNTLVISFVPDAPIDAVQLDAVVEVFTDLAALPDWWRLHNPGSCREILPTMTVAFPNGSCADPWQGSATVAASSPYLITGGRASLAVTVSAASPASLNDTYEYYGLNMHIANIRTVGAPSCAGCPTPACLFVGEITLRDGAGNTQRVHGPQEWNRATWQGGPLFPGNPCAPIPVRNRTWGQIKGQYR